MVRQSKRHTKRNTRRSRTRRSIKRGGNPITDFFSSKSPAQLADEQRIEDSCKQQLDAVVKKYAQQSATGSPAPAYGPTSYTPTSGQPNDQQQRSMFAGRRRRSRKH